MTVKTERITILGTPDFKKFLVNEAKKEGVSLSLLIRRRCEQRPVNDDEQILMDLLAELSVSTAKAKNSLDKGLEEARKLLAEIKTRDKEIRAA
jgi:hypothetical protein